MTNSLKIVETADGSSTLLVPALNEHYHSTFGALTESRHVFIEAGFLPACEKFDNLNILEVGFGTGLNALLTIAEAEKLHKQVSYTAIEPYPVDVTLINKLNYTDEPDLKNYAAAFSILHHASCISCPPSPILHHDSCIPHPSSPNHHNRITAHFTIQKIICKLENYQPPPVSFGLVYFDAFSPDKQPEMWSETIFKKIFDSMTPEGILVTYCVKGEVVRTLRKIGFRTEKLPGPPGKRHMLRTVKI